MWNSGWKGSMARAVAIVLLVSSVAFAENESDRKVKVKIAPEYPELARRLNVTGKVKLEVVIAPDGRVKSSRVVGGHPILGQACINAVKDWKFAPGPEETTQILEFLFRG